MLTAWRRPGHKHMKPILKEIKGITMIITCQKTSEKPENIKAHCKEIGMKHWHINMDGPKSINWDDAVETNRLKDCAKEVFDYLVDNEEKALLHCAAGMHRTGMMCYTLLRHSGLNSQEAYNALGHMRKITFEEVGDHRIQLAEEKLFLGATASADTNNMVQISSAPVSKASLEELEAILEDK